jgi:hypothetical protein
MVTDEISKGTKHYYRYGSRPSCGALCEGEMRHCCVTNGEVYENRGITSRHID